jgi:hypothetical protein
MVSSIGKLLVLLYALPAASQVTRGSGNCTCGFLDSLTGEVFTDSLIVYFNETDSLPDDLIAEQYTNKYEKDWNAIYRQAADPANLQFGNGSTQLLVQPSTKEHVVQGAGFRTARRDIQHGSFRTLIKSPKQFSDGSAMSMMWQYNETETAEVSVMNTNDPSEAWVGTFINGEFTTRDLGTNFTQALTQPAANRNYSTLGGGLDNGSVNPWEFTEYRIDWTGDHINFYVGGNLTRQVLHKDNKGMPSVPAPLYFKHWSTGNRFSMDGPPLRPSAASIGWIRVFFNSSTTTNEAREAFDTQCTAADTCSMDDYNLRGSTEFVEDATVQWKQNKPHSFLRWPAVWLSVGCIAFSTFLLIHTFIRRIIQPKKTSHAPPPTPISSSAASTDQSMEKGPKTSSEYLTETSGSSKGGSTNPSRPSSVTDDLAIEKLAPSTAASIAGGTTLHGPSPTSSVLYETPPVLSHFDNSFNLTQVTLLPTEDADRLSPYRGSDHAVFLQNGNSQQTTDGTKTPHQSADKIQMETVTESALPAPRMQPQPPAPRDRVDYLAGLVALCAVIVTVMHFGLTFVPAIVIPGAPQHAKSEWWAQKIVAPFILNQMWLGVFFTTSVRFLSAGYLKRGKMSDVAKAAVRRVPRLMIPVATIALLEYFLIDCGATKYLRYIPSLTWSTWPYVTRYENFLQYLSEILELVFLIPNAVPQITFNYCTGVLWTIAVQLQGTWLVLLGIIVVYEIKTTWKRMLFYLFCLVNHWYAQSWGAYFWLGLLLTDLDVTYAYKKWLYARPGVYYPLILTCWVCVAAGFAANLLPSWVSFNFATEENNIHPDWQTGEPLMNTDRAGYPPYYTPRLNGLLFAGGMQAIVELSTAVQWFLSTPPLLVLFPHIFTIYLMHGIVFWSWGSWLMVFLAKRDFSYGVNVVVVGVSSYVLLFMTLPVITPVVEALGKDITALVWMTAQEKSPPRRRTLFPFSGDFLTARGGAEGAAETGAGAQGRGPSGVGDGDVEKGFQGTAKSVDDQRSLRSSSGSSNKTIVGSQQGEKRLSPFGLDGKRRSVGE